MKIGKMLCMLLIVFAVGINAGLAHAADQFRIAIMQDDKDAAKKFKPIEEYLAKSGVNIVFSVAPNYSNAAYMFREGKVDAMFSGSGIAGIFIKKGLAAPVLRPVSKEGFSTYHAVVLAHKGSPAFTGNAGYFANKRVVFTELASSGEIYFHSIPKIKLAQAKVLKIATHGDAILALAKGAADVAIVKNRVWDKHASEYPDIAKVGEDTQENPDSTLIVSKKTDKKVVSKVAEALLALKDDKSPEANAVRAQMGVKGYIKTTVKDFEHTFELLRKAGVDDSFDFKF
jgi:ABC-type phosphate/phosphonate transport system substrate-binding protein